MIPPLPIVVLFFAMALKLKQSDKQILARVKGSFYQPPFGVM